MKVFTTDKDFWAFFKEVIDALPYYVMIIDETHNIIIANEAVMNHLKVEPDTIVGSYCPKVVHGLDTPYPGCPLEEAVEKGHSIVKEMKSVENQRWIETTAYLTNKLTKDGKRIYIHTVKDIDERKRAQEDLDIKKRELERWQELTIHREVRMYDLKKEIKGLENKLIKDEKKTK